MQAVQPAHGARAVAVRAVLTAARAVLVLLALNAPERPRGARAWARSCGCRSRRWSSSPWCSRCRAGSGRSATVLAVVGRRACSGLTARPQRPRHRVPRGARPALRHRSIDWRYAGSLVELVRGLRSASGWAAALLVGAARRVPSRCWCCCRWRCCRLTRVAARHRHRRGAGASPALAALWVVLAVLDVHAAAGAVASRDTAGYVYGQVTRIPARARATSASSPRRAEEDPLRRRPPERAAGRAARARTSCSSSWRATAGSRSRGRRSRPGSARCSSQGPSELGARGLRQPQRLPHLPDVRRAQLAGPRDAPVRAVGRQPAALRRAGRQRRG